MLSLKAASVMQRPVLGKSSFTGGPVQGSRSPCLHYARGRKAFALKAEQASTPAPSITAPASARDEFMELSRKDMRHVFDPDRWEIHRGNGRYLRHMMALPKSRILVGLTKPLLYVVGISTALGCYETLQAAHLLPPMFGDMSIKSKELFGLTSFALALLLAYRTNASYGRWDEVRKMWGLVLNRSRDITRQGLVWIPDSKPELRDMLCRWVPAFSKALMCHLRKGEDLRKELEGILLPHEVDSVLKAQHRPNYVLQVLGEIVYEARMPTPPSIVMDQNLTAFADCLGGCERILRTPIPVSYTRHTSRFLMIWLTLLPFSLWPTAGWGTVPLSAIIAFLLLGVEKIGVSVEEPFTIIALEAISNTALTNVRELKAMHDTGRLVAEPEFSAAEMVVLAQMGRYGNGAYSNGNGAYANGNGAYANGNGNGNGLYVNGNGASVSAPSEVKV